MNTTKKQKITIIPSKSPNVFRIGRKLFILKEEKIGKDNHIKKLIFEETKQKEYVNELKSLAEEILKTKDIDRKVILEQALGSLSKNELIKVRKGLNKFKKPKLKRGCLNLNIDGIEVPIFNKASFLDK